MGNVEQELLAEVAAARAAQAAHRKHSERVKELLVEYRKEHPDAKLADIESLIDCFYERASISRFTAGPLRRARAARVS